jgi:copper chaperone
MVTTIYVVTGMMCEHCVRAVTQELEGLGGVRGVTVDLVPGGESRVTVTGDAPVTDQTVAAALDEAGAYRMVAA